MTLQGVFAAIPYYSADFGAMKQITMKQYFVFTAAAIIAAFTQTYGQPFTRSTSGPYIYTTAANDNLALGRSTGFSSSYRLDVLGTTRLTNVSGGHPLLIECDNTDSWVTFHDPNDAVYSLGIDRSNSGRFSLNYGTVLGAAGHKPFVFDRLGYFGINTSAPVATLDMGPVLENTLSSVLARQSEGNATGSGTFLGVKAYGTQFAYDNGKSFSIEHNFYGVVNSSINFYRGSGTSGGFLTFNNNNNLERMRITSSGLVGIGTKHPDAELTVYGVVHSKEVRVDLNVPGPDYVFASTYNLRPLNEVSLFIRRHNHLPEVPSAKQLEKNGIQLGEMSMLLLKKIEELTLYVIEQEATNDDQAKRILDQEDRIRALERMISEAKD